MFPRISKVKEDGIFKVKMKYLKKSTALEIDENKCDGCSICIPRGAGLRSCCSSNWLAIRGLDRARLDERQSLSRLSVLLGMTNEVAVQCGHSDDTHLMRQRLPWAASH